jgi:hypothetical protein
VREIWSEPAVLDDQILQRLCLLVRQRLSFLAARANQMYVIVLIRTVVFGSGSEMRVRDDTELLE